MVPGAKSQRECPPDEPVGAPSLRPGARVRAPLSGEQNSATDHQPRRNGEEHAARDMKPVDRRVELVETRVVVGTVLSPPTGLRDAERGCPTHQGGSAPLTAGRSHRLGRAEPRRSAAAARRSWLRAAHWSGPTEWRRSPTARPRAVARPRAPPARDARCSAGLRRPLLPSTPELKNFS